MAAIVVASNILVQFLFGQWLTWGAFTYPLAFLVTDLMNRVYGAGPRAHGGVRRVYRRVDLFPDRHADHGRIRAAGDLAHRLGSGIAFLTAQLLDVGIFSALRAWRLVERAAGLDTGRQSSVDTALFFTIAFSASLAFLEPCE